jgi:hypothetical protein
MAIGHLQNCVGSNIELPTLGFLHIMAEPLESL